MLQNSQKFPVLWHGRTEVTYVIKMTYPCPGYSWHRTSRSSGYGYEGHTELPEVPGTGMNVLQNSQIFLYQGRVIPGVNTPGMVCAYPTEHNLENFHGDSNNNVEYIQGVPIDLAN